MVCYWRRDIRRPPLTVCPVMPRISTILISMLAVRTLRKMKWCGGDGLLLEKRYKAAAFDSGSSLATNFNEFTTQNSRYARSASKREEVIMKWCGGDGLLLEKRYKAAAFDSGSSLATNFNEFTSQNSRYARSGSKREEVIMKWCGGDGLLLEKGYKAATFDSGSSLPTNFNEFTSQNSRYACHAKLHLEILTAESQCNTTLYLTFRVGPLGGAQGCGPSGGFLSPKHFPFRSPPIPFMLQVLSFWSLSSREDLETPTGCHWSESPLCTFGDFANLSGRVDLEISAGCLRSEF
ncbi:hypothetical protein HZH68_012710 [Vespula germanica]|uniref:Uncharacterized protein n=1 Tax=Vespula germanica TaxID=30212 RepID=A0A834MXU7_VESGE|nr:hypothetical protein HZH68_012710 [Vespula germanica]